MAAVPEPTTTADGFAPLPGLVDFAASGLLHWLGNSLFAIQGHAQMLGLDPAPRARGVQEVLKGARQAQSALDVFRWLVADRRSTQPIQIGVLLPRLCEGIRIPLRARGIGLDHLHTSNETPRHVCGVVATQAIVGVVRTLVGRLPAGYEGRLVLDLTRQTPNVELALRLVPAGAMLPFRVAIPEIAAAANDSVRGLDVAVAGDHVGQRLTLTLPPVNVSG